MLNTKKLLYILPDAAYLAEVLPTKKEHTFSIHSFRQINGNFIDENEFIVENVTKLIHKIDTDEYHLILPDFLFTNTIIDIKETKESAVKAYLKEKLLPSLDLSADTHEIDTFILTQHGGKSKVQLSAIEKSLLEPIKTAAEAQKIMINQISPLSWTIKSAVSLEPSLSTIQMGEMLYLALHYIGVDQTISFPLTETANIIETVKTLKGAEPNIQTMYLLTNAVVEQQIKEHLSGTLPIQQLTNLTDETEGIPSFIKQIILSGARTLDIQEMQIPRFPLMAQTKAKHNSISPAAAAQSVAEIGEEPETESELPPPTLPNLPLKSESKPELKISPEDLDATLPTIAKPTLAKSALPTVSIEDEEDDFELDTEDEVGEPKEVTPPEPTIAPVVSLSAEPVDPFALAPLKADEPKTDEPKTAAPLFSRPPVAPKPELVPAAPLILPSKYQVTLTDDMKATMPLMNSAELAQTDEVGEESVDEKPLTESAPTGRKVIKNNNDAGALLKIILITLGALVTTVAVGVGIGFGLLKLSEKNSPTEVATTVKVSPSVAPVATVLPSPTPIASPAATLNKATFKILVVNATGIAGRAGKVKTSLSTAGYKAVSTGNASGTYTTKGNFLLIDPKNASYLSVLTTDSNLTLSIPTTTKISEDPKQAYDAVIVVNQ